MCITAPTALAVGAGVQGIGGLISGMMGSGAARTASRIEADAARDAMKAQIEAIRSGMQTSSQGALTAAQLQSSGILAGGETTATGLLRGAETQAGGVLSGADMYASSILSGAQTQATGVQQGTAKAVGGFNQAIDRTNLLYADSRAALDPYLETGRQGTAKVNALLGNGDPAAQMAALEATPGYQFALTQGLRATQNSMTARGLGNSGAAQRAAADYATGLAQQTYSTIFNQAMQAAQVGQTATGQLASTNQNFGNMLNELFVGRGGVESAGAMKMAEILGLATTKAGEVRGGALAEAGRLRGLGESEAARVRGEAATGAAGATAQGHLLSSQALAAGQTAIGATRAAGIMGRANALASGEIGATNALTGGTNALFTGFGNALTSVGLFNSGLFANGQNPLMPNQQRT